MQSTPKSKKSLRVFSIVQLVLGLVFIILLFTVRFGRYYTAHQTVGYVWDYNYYNFFINDSVYTRQAAAGIVIMYLIFIFSSIYRILSRNIFGTSRVNKIMNKIAKFTPLVGLGIIVFGLLATNQFDRAMSNIYNIRYGWQMEGTALIFIGGLIVAITGLVANRLSRPQRPIGYSSYVEPQASPSYQQPQVPTQPSYSCPSCGAPLTFVSEYNRWYCYNCKKYQ